MAEQSIYKDLLGDRKAKLKDFIFNPKAVDPVGADQTPQELYNNTTDNQLKYYDDNLDLRYAVPGIVKAIAPTPLDLDYEIGQEWHLDNHSATYKLLGKETINGALEAVWIEEKLLKPLIKVSAHLDFYVDYGSGSDSDEGDIANPFKTIQGAINKISREYDFQNVYRYTITVNSAIQPVGTIYFRKPEGYGGQLIIIKGATPETELDSTTGNMFISRDDMEIRLQNFKFIGNSSTAFVNSTKGVITVLDCVLTGSCLYPFLGGGEARLIATNNKIDNLIGTNLIRLGVRSSYFQNGNFEAIGANSFVQVIYTGNYTYCQFNVNGTLTLAAGATVTGRRFVTYHSSSILFSDFDHLNDWGDIRGSWLSDATYRDRGTTFYNYPHWIQGLEISQSGTDLAIAGGEYRLKLNQSNKALEYFVINVLRDQTIPFADTRLDTLNEVWVYVKDQEVIEFLAIPPDPDNLLTRICLGKITTTDNATFASVEPLISERSPEFLDSLNAPGSIASCVVANHAINTLNDTLAGIKVPLDPGAYSTSSSMVYSLSANNVTVASAGFYKIEADLNCSVPTTGTQRPSVAVRIAINDVQRTKAGRSGYIRRASGHLRASSNTSAMVFLNPGDQISMWGFRDAAGGVVDCPVGESELTILKLT